MYPNDIFLGLDFYSILICIGIFICILMFGRLADRLFLSAKLQKFCFVCALFAIPLGYGASVIVQALYNIKSVGKFVLSTNTGATFYGGLLGGAGVFLLIYFVIGHFVFSDGYNVRNFFGVANCATCSILVAHAFGRLGCLMAGCCHGKVTDAWYGITMNGVKYVPIQLFESMFLFCLLAVAVTWLIKGKSCNLPLYMMIYGAWRFVIEYFRGDERGNTIVSFLSPSQLTAIILILSGVALLLFERYYEKRHADEITKDAKIISEKRSSEKNTEKM